MRLFVSAISTVWLALAAASPAIAQDEAGDFDFYVLAMSWSPAYCTLEGEAEGSEQCGGADFGFVAHGLWPQYERGYPDYCEDVERPPRDVIDSVSDIMPDAGLVRYEWRKHGSCTGLSAEDYFDETRAAFERVAVPESVAGDEDGYVSASAVEQAFADANPGLDEDGIAVSCKDGLFAEVRICLTPELDFRSCPEVDKRGCGSRSIYIVPPG